MINRKKLGTFGAAVTIGLALVGVGTGAQFSDAVTGTQNISTGTADLAITSAPGGEISPDGQSVTYDLKNAGSSFIQDHEFTVSNVGTLPMHDITLTVTGTGDAPLMDNVWMYVSDWEALYDYAEFGTVSQVIAAPQPVTSSDRTLQPAGTGYHESFPVDMRFYSPDYLGGDSLPNAAQGKAMTVTVTVNAVEGTGTEPWFTDGSYLTEGAARPSGPDLVK